MDYTSEIIDYAAEIKAAKQRTSKRQRAIDDLNETSVDLHNERERLPPADLQAYLATVAGLRVRVQALTADNSPEARALRKEAKTFRYMVLTHTDSIRRMALP